MALVGYLAFAQAREIKGAEARALVARGAVLLDVRTAQEFAQGHLPSAVNVPVQELEGRSGELGARDHDIVVYCRSGHRSARAVEILQSQGFTHVFNLGPMSAW